MPTLVDEFVVLFGLDPTGHTRGSKEVRRNTKLTRDEALSGAKDMEAAGKRAAMFFSQIKTQAVGALLAFAGATGLKNLAGQLVSTSANVGRLSTLVGTSTEELSAWQGALGKVGGKAADADAAIRAMSAAFQSYKLTGSTGIDADLMGLGVTVGDLESPTRALVKMAEAAERMTAPEFTARMQRIGIPESMIVLLQRGRAETERLVAEQKRLYVVTERDTQAAQRFEAAWSTLKSTIWGAVQGPLTNLLEALPKIAAGFKNADQWTFQLAKRLGEQIDSGIWQWLTKNANDASSGYSNFARSVLTAWDALKKFTEYGRSVASSGWAWLKENAFGMNAAEAAPTARGATGAGGSSADAVWASIVQQESGGRAGVVGPATARTGGATVRALGMTQMLPATARETAAKLGVPYRADLMTGTGKEAADYQLKLGRAYFDEGVRRSRGDLREAAKFYHGGPNKRFHGPITEGYADQVLARAARGGAIAAMPRPSSPMVAPSAPAQGTSIGVINVYTAATDAAGIARDLPAAVGARRVTTQANRGLK